MKKGRFILWLAGMLLTMAPTAGLTQHAEKPPNIIIVLADDLTWDDLGCMGSPSVKTPNIDRIASAGVVFDRLYTCTSVCVPTRFQLNTGRMPAFGRMFGNSFSGLEGLDYATLPTLLQDAGYRTALAGKTHFPNKPAVGEQRFRYEILAEDYGPIVEAAETFLQQEHDRPFLLYVGSHEPHASWKTVGSVTYDPAEVQLPAYLPDLPAIRELFAAYLGEVTALDDQVGAVFDALQASPYRDNTLFLFMTEHGSQIPRGKGSSYELGIRSTMVAWWPARLAAGRRCDALLHYVDVMPTLLDLIGAPEAQSIDGKSFLPVLLGESDTFRDEVYSAKSNRNGDTRAVGTRKWKYVWKKMDSANSGYDVDKALDGWSYQGLGGSPNQMSNDFFLSIAAARKAGLEDKRADVIVQYRTEPRAEELYDLENDPYELNNLLQSAEAPQAVLADMRRRLAIWLDQQNDPHAKAFRRFLAERSGDPILEPGSGRTVHD